MPAVRLARELIEAGELGEIRHFRGRSAIAEDTDVAPHGATFEDGYRAAEVCDAIVRSSQTGSRVTVPYR